jgi:pectin methylesterase-like acyl-CoA thioesterase
MRRRTFLILAGASLLAPSALAADAAPADIVAEIYRIYAGPKGEYQSGSIEDKRVAAFFTKSLRAALKAMDARSKKINEPILDFDPVTDSQDPMVERLSIAPESDSVVAASFYSGDVKHVVRYVFAREDGAWRIDDIAGGAGDDKWDLREIIKPGAK